MAKENTYLKVRVQRSSRFKGRAGEMGLQLLHEKCNVPKSCFFWYTICVFFANFLCSRTPPDPPPPVSYRIFVARTVQPTLGVILYQESMGLLVRFILGNSLHSLHSFMIITIFSQNAVIPQPQFPHPRGNCANKTSVLKFSLGNYLIQICFWQRFPGV